MDQENTNSNDNNSNAPPATDSDSMSPGKDSTTGDGSKTDRSLVDKGKGVAKTEEGGSMGKSTALHVDVAVRDGRRSGGRRGDREVHIVTERERRKRMGEMFTKLHGFLPGLPDKIDKSSIVMEAIHYIKSLEVTVSELERQKLEMQLARCRRAPAHGGISSSSTAPHPAVVAPPQPVLPVGGISWPTEAAPAVPPGPAAVTAAPAPAPAGLQTWSGPNVVLSVTEDDAYINVCVARRPGVLTMVAAVLEKHSIDVVTSGIASDSSRSMFTIHARVNGASSQFGNNMASEEIYKLAVSEIMVWLSD